MPAMTVKCTACGHIEDIIPGKVSTEDYPMCPKCYMPMFPHTVKSNADRRR